MDYAIFVVDEVIQLMSVVKIDIKIRIILVILVMKVIIQQIILEGEEAAQ